MDGEVPLVVHREVAVRPGFDPVEACGVADGEGHLVGSRGEMVGAGLQPRPPWSERSWASDQFPPGPQGLGSGAAWPCEVTGRYSRPARRFSIWTCVMRSPWTMRSATSCPSRIRPKTLYSPSRWAAVPVVR